VSQTDTIRDADPKLLRELADAIDEDRGHGKSLLTLTMRQAADDLEALLALSSLQAQEIDAFDAENQQLRDALERIMGLADDSPLSVSDAQLLDEIHALADDALAAVRVEER
jgi:hypothetical protein